MEAIGKFTVGLAMIVFGFILGGWVLSVLWGWFIVPIFGLTALTLSRAIGLKLVVSILTTQGLPKSDKTKSTMEELLNALCVSLVLNFGLLAVGWIVRYFI